MKTKAFFRSRNQRKKVEMRIAHLKSHHHFERLRLRGLSGARDEFHLAAIVQNLKTMALRLLGPPPAECTRQLRRHAVLVSVGVAAAGPMPSGPKADRGSRVKNTERRNARSSCTFFDSIGPEQTSVKVRAWSNGAITRFTSLRITNLQLAMKSETSNLDALWTPPRLGHRELR